MSENFRRQRPSSLSLRYARLHRAQPGQTLVVALAVLFILLFIGGVFVVRVARNLTDSARGRDTEDARALAEAGLKYCDNELNGSPDGADWRPIPTAPIGPNNGANDPDYFWLQRGFTRLNLKGGRSLVRVSYDPDPDNPVGQAIKIESIGRSGELDPTDPTVFVQNQTSPRLRRELVAYKRIGITDYLRFFTDKDHGNHENFIGVPAVGHFFPQVYGNPMLAMNAFKNGVSGTETLYGGPIYCNSNLSIIGDTYFYEGPRGADPSKQQEAIQVAGNITANQFSDTNLPPAGTYASPTATRFNLAQPTTQAYIGTPIDGTGTKQPITPTLDKNAATTTFGPNQQFNTYGKTVRDGSPLSAANGDTRGVTRFTPPSIDTNLTNTGNLRVRQITRESGYWQTQTFNTGMHGWGSEIYVDNNADLQQETLTPGINGSYSLPTDWTNPNAGFAQSAWNGPYYRPPGVLIELLGDRMRLTRSDGKPFYKSDGNPTTTQGNGGTIEIPFSDLERGQLPTVAGQPVIPPFAHDGDEPIVSGADPRNANDPVAGMTIDPHSYGVNIVLFAEGNIRVKGVYGTLTDTTATPTGGAKGFLSRVHLTLITGGTAYIEGSLLKGDGTIAGAGATPVLQRNSTCSILAKDYVCVNTSMFMSPQNQTNVWSRITPDIDLFATEIGEPRTTYDTSFVNGVSPSSYTVGGAAMPQLLNLRHTSVAPGPTAINLLINPALDDGTGNTEYLWPFFTPPAGTQSRTYPVGARNIPGQAIFTSDPAAVTPRFEAKTFPIDNSVNTNAAQSLITYPGYDNLFRIQVDQTLQVTSTGIALGPLQSYLLSAIMVTPLDIRIEAALYAQEKSFFIIPGYAFNGDPNDTRAHAVATGGTRASYSIVDGTAATLVNDRLAKDRFPYTNEPLDARITICGAIAESYSANVGAQAAWLKNWGYLPAAYGSSNTQVPDDHLFARMPRPSANLPLGYVAGDTSSTADYRSPLESTITNGNDFLLTRSLQFEYDPALAMPYFHSTDTNLTGQNLARRKTRMGRSMRFIKRTLTKWDGTNDYEFRQTLPPMPRLPIGPDLIYSGSSDVQLGEQDFDTDQFKP